MRAAEFVNEKWSEKYKRSIDCSHPRGFSQRAHCQGRKKHNEDIETQYQVVCDGTKKGIFTDKDAAIRNAKSMFKHEKEYYHIAVVDLNTGKEVWSWSKANEHIVKHGSGYRLVSKKTGKNLGDFPTRAAAEKHEREVEYFKHVKEGQDTDVVFGIDSEDAFNAVMDKFGSVIEWAGDDMVAPRKYWGAIQATAYDNGGDATEVGEEQLDELTFLGSQCTKDCSGHRAGYAWSQKHGGMDSASWSPSFNKGAWLHNNGF